MVTGNKEWIVMSQIIHFDWGVQHEDLTIAKQK